MGMIYDTFNFNNELDLLEIRFNILDKYVDKFVIVESDVTFSGKYKNLYFKENEERFAKWKDKIIHYVVWSDKIYDSEYVSALVSPNIGAGEDWWVEEFIQKECLLRPLKDCKDDDIIFVSDVDEIWNDFMFCVDVEDDKVYRPEMVEYYYYLNLRSDRKETHTGTRFGTYKTLKKYGANHFRTEREVKGIKIPNGGWHFNALGGKEKKMKDFQHPVYTSEYMDNRTGNLTKDEKGLPDYIINNKEIWKHLLL